MLLDLLKLAAMRVPSVPPVEMASPANKLTVPFVQAALLLIKQYEDANYPVPVPDPIAVIKLKMLEMGLKNKDLVGEVGSKGYVSPY